MRILLLALVMILTSGLARAEPLTVFAASSLRGPLEEALAAWPVKGGAPPQIVYAGSSALARQIRAGAPADVFISANTLWMNALETEGMVSAPTRRAIAANALVLVSGDTASVTPTELAELPADARIAMALVNAVPAGIYGRDAMVSLGLWDRVRPHVVELANVRVALALASRGEADYAVVYASDARLDPALHVALAFPADSHAPIVYPAAALVGAHGEASALVDWLAGPEAQAIFAKHGFLPPPGP